MKTVFSLWLSAALLVPAVANAGTEELAKDRNCFACHKLEGQRIGPSFIAVAKKYAQDTAAQATISKHIQEGSIQGEANILPPQPIVGTVSGLLTVSQWHQLAMPPQPQVNREEAKQLAEWILSLGK